MKLMKVFNISELSKEAQDCISNHCSGYEKIYVFDEQKPIEVVDASKCSYIDNLELSEDTGGEILFEEILSGLRYVVQRGDNALQDWLFDQGVGRGEEILVNCS